MTRDAPSTTARTGVPLFRVSFFGAPFFERILAGTALAGAVLVGLPAGGSAQGMEDVEIRTVPVAEGIHMLQGRGGNLGVHVGPDGVFVIDDQYAPLTDRILDAIRELSEQPVRFVLNTHWHGDHTGGNENMGRAGALLVAHDRVRQRLSVEQVLERLGSAPDTVAPAPPGALPVVTFDEEITFHLDGDEVRVLHVPAAHTDGDAIIHFTERDVVHMGDTFFRGGYPFIDVGSGGTIDGFLTAQRRALDLMGPETRVIPGHGPLASRDELRRKHDILWQIRSRVWAAKLRGDTLDEALARELTGEWDPELGGGFVSPAALVQSVWASLPEGR